MIRLVDGALAIALAAAVVGGAYYMGKQSERRWWRAELAAKSGAVQAIINKAGLDAEGIDARLVAEIGAVDAKLSEAEGRVQRVASPAAPAAAAGDPCHPQPAQCLRRDR